MIRVFVGTDGDLHQDAEKVLEYSIRVNTEEEVDLVFMRPGWKTPPTGFASHRYLIPQLCDYKGYAIYLDVDMLILGDLSELWSYKTKGRWCIPKHKGGPRDEVSVIDCSVFKELPTVSQLKTRQGKSIAKSRIGDRYLSNIPETWNASLLSPCTKWCCSLKGETPKDIPGETKLLHYTNLRTQPWHPDPTVDYQPFPCTRTEDLFWQYLEEANKHD